MGGKRGGKMSTSAERARTHIGLEVNKPEYGLVKKGKGTYTCEE